MIFLDIYYSCNTAYKSFRKVAAAVAIELIEDVVWATICNQSLNGSSTINDDDYLVASEYISPERRGQTVEIKMAVRIKWYCCHDHLW